jgi:hypothetical protein
MALVGVADPSHRSPEVRRARRAPHGSTIRHRARTALMRARYVYS